MSDGEDRCGRRSRALRLEGPIFLLSVLSTVGACATHKPPPAQAVKPPPPQKLAWMPLDPLDAPSVAGAVNDTLSRTEIKGTAPTVKAAVSMEVAQLAIECIQPTPACYRAVGHSLGADRLLWAEIDPTAPEDKIRITVVMFDVRAGTASREAATYDGVQAARAGIAQLVEHAARGGSRAP
jgi:hypothetical protein